MPSWVDILEQVGWPTDVLVLDFECFFSAEYGMGRGAKSLSTVEYVMDERYHETGLACVRMKGHRPRCHVVPDFDHDSSVVLEWCQKEYGLNLEGCTVVGHNLAFDGFILAMRYGIIPPYAVDTLGLARHINPAQQNDLASLCKRHGLQDKGDTSQFKGYGLTAEYGPPTWDAAHVFTKKRRRKLKTPRLYHSGDYLNGGLYQEVLRAGMTAEMRADLAEYAENDALQEWYLFEKLLPRLSNPALELPLMRHTLGLFWEPCIEVDLDAGEKLATAMEEKVREVAEAIGHTPEELRKATFATVLLAEALGDEPVPMKLGKNGPIPALAKNDAGLAYLKAHPIPRVRELVAARAAVKSWPLHSARVRRILSQARAAGGRLPVPLKYCGAHTGRWSGGERINLQNLTHRSPEELINQIRGLLIAPPEHVLVVADASQVEARGLDFTAGQEDMVEAWRNNESIYCQFASDVLGYEVDKSMKNDRNLGKVGILGCGYGMGAARCFDYAVNVFRVEGMTEDLAARIVGHYRETHRQVCRFWRDVEDAFVYVTRYPHETRTLAHELVFSRRGDVTAITLPSGRNLLYHGVGVSGTGRERQIKWPNSQRPGSWTHAWGGFLVENIVQALCRDLLGEAILLTEHWGQEIGLRIGHHVHDEIIGVVREEHGERALQLEIAALSTNPEWLQRCPLAAEGQIARRYGK